AGSSDDAAASDTGSTASESETAGPAHSVPVPGLKEEDADQIPQETSQVLVATSPDAKSEESTLSFYRFADEEWTKHKTVSTDSGSHGCLEDRHEGDRRTPIGVCTLRDARGYSPGPGTELPYTHDDSLPSSATVAHGPDYASVVAYIIAIDYNRVPG